MTAMMTASTETSERRTILSGRSDLLQHHRILDVQILPGAGFVAMAIEASTGHAGGGYQRQSLRLLRPLPVPEDQESEVSASVERRADGALAVRVRSHPVGVEDGWVEHASGVAVPVSAMPPETLDLAGIMARATSIAAQEEIYQVYALTGIALGKAFQVIQRAWLISQFETIAELRFGEAAHAALPGHAFNPAMLDGCFQATYGVVLPRMLAELRTDGAAPQWTMVPYRVSKLVVHRSLPEHAYSYVRLLEQHPTRDLSSITVADAEGRVCLSFELLSVRIAVRDVVRSIGAAAQSPETMRALAPQPPPLRGANIGFADVPTVGKGEPTLTPALSQRERESDSPPPRTGEGWTWSTS